MDFDEYETLPTNNFSIHMTAGAIAGVMEHCVMYPFDSVKTRMQCLSPQAKYSGVLQTLLTMTKQEGIKRPFRGLNVVVIGAGPAHALYFSCYEHLKEKIQTRTSQPFYVVAGLSGTVATLLHDGLMTPAEVVKQRMQMFNSPYRSMSDCIRRTYQAEGMRAFYRSYTTQLMMNVPFQSIHFITYEMCQRIFNKDKQYNPVVHMASGGVAGAFAAAITTPLDVVKTLLNTQQQKVIGMTAGIKTVYRLSGFSGYFKGLRARILFQFPATAICWSMYELFKYVLTKSPEELKCNDRSLSPKVLVSESISPSLRPGLRLVVPEVNLEPRKSPESMFISDRRDYDSKNWGSTIPLTISDESPGNYRHDDRYDSTSRSRSDKERTSEWNPLLGSGTIKAVTYNTIHRTEDSCQTRTDMFTDMITHR